MPSNVPRQLTDRCSGTIIVDLFRLRPVLATAIVGVPAVALLATIGLCVARLASAVRAELSN